MSATSSRVSRSIDGTLHPVKINVIDGSLPIPTDVANYDLTTTPITVTLSGTINKEHVERALGHEITEIQSIIEERAGGPARSATHNVLATDSTAKALSHDDRGRIGELRVLTNDLATGKRPKAETRAEITRLLSELGMLNTDGTAFNTNGLGMQRRALMTADGVDFNALGAALNFTPSGPTPHDPTLPLRGDHVDPDAVPRLDITSADVLPHLRADVLAAFADFGLSAESVVQYIVDHHNDRSQKRHQADLQGLERKSTGFLSAPDVLLIDLYTTKLFYKELNTRLRTTVNRDAALALARLLNISLAKLPPVVGTSFRSINISGAGPLAGFLASYPIGGTVEWTSYSSVGSELGGTMADSNIVFEIKNATAYDITNFADGMAYKSPPNPGRELLIPAGAQVRVVSVTQTSPGKWHIGVEQTGSSTL